MEGRSEIVEAGLRKNLESLNLVEIPVQDQRCLSHLFVSTADSLPRYQVVKTAPYSRAVLLERRQKEIHRRGLCVGLEVHPARAAIKFHGFAWKFVRLKVMNHLQ